MTKNDLICRDFQIWKFDRKKIVPAVTMQMDINLDQLLLKRDELNKISKVHITIYRFLLKVIADVLVKYPLLFSLYYKKRITENRTLIISVPVSVDAHVEYIVIRNPNNKTLEEIATEMQDGIDKIKNGTNMLMNSLIELSKLNSIQKVFYKMKNWKNPFFFLENYYGYFPVTNFGTFQVNGGTTVLAEPIVSGLAIGKTETKLALVNNEVIKQNIISLTLSFDHRVMDGAYAGNFLNELKQRIEELN